MFDPATAALLVIDMQNGWCHPEGAMSRAGVDMTRQIAVVEPVCRLVEACRAAGMPVAWSLQQHFQADAARSRHSIPTHLDKRNILPAPRGSWDAELVEPLGSLSRPDDFFFVKHKMSCFYNTTLEVVLRALGATTLVIAGVSTNVCVESTIRDAYFRDLDVVVVRECVAGTFPDLHQATLRNVEIYFGQVARLDDVRDSLSHGVASEGSTMPEPSH